MSSIISLANKSESQSNGHDGWLTGYFRKLVKRKITSLEGADITLCECFSATSGGEPGSLGDDDLIVEINNPAFYRRVVTNGSLGAAESYIRGEWDTENLTDLLRAFVRQLKSGFHLSNRYSVLSDWFSRAFHWARRNTRIGSKKNISAHYDLGNDFFRLMLDESMTYSSGVFVDENTSLAASQKEKYNRLCKFLDLQPQDHLLEIGTGWGGMAIHAASEFGCKVTTTTISQEQFDFARQRIAEKGLDDRVTVVLEDYRDLEGSYDKMASIEMIEAVGHDFLPGYFRKCSSLLKPGGRFAFQVISMPDQNYRGYLKRADFIQRYVFPGSCCPALGALVDAYSQTDFRSEITNNIGPDYATTLRLWRENFENNISRIRDLGYPEEFLRLWRYYLCYCEAGFAENYLNNYQIMLSKGGIA